MLYYIKKYPVSLVIILAVIYLSFFKPPTTDLGTIPNLDKVVHICMYFGMSGMLWLEFLRAHRRDRVARMGRSICLSGIVQRSGRIVTGILYYLPWRRLAGFCSQYHGSCPGVIGGLFRAETKSDA